ncbi:unnamed protein product [Urochloa humidicola]
MNEKCLSYLLVCWNVRGLGSSDKCDEVRSSIDLLHPHLACLQETKLNSLPNHHPPFLPRNLDSWLDVPANLTRGGICTAWNSQMFSRTSFITRRYSFTVGLSSTLTNHVFSLANIYAPSDHRDTDAFFHELQELSTHIHGAWLLAGDFNLLRSPVDKNTSNFNTSLASSFNNTINDLALLEVPLLDRLYTWSSKRITPTLAKLDCVFLNLDFSTLLPDTSLTSNVSTTSDHVPLLLTIRTETPCPNTFRFENSWLQHPLFLPAVLPAWSAPVHAVDGAGAVVARVKALHGAAKVWSRAQHSPPHIFSDCSFLILLMDLLEERRPLNAGERRLRLCCQERAALYIRQRAAHWKQRGKFRAIKEGDANTRFFQARASMRLRRNKIRVLEVDGARISSHAGKTAALTAYYSTILGRADDTDWGFDVHHLYSHSTRADAVALVAPFTAAEAHAAVNAMNAFSAPGPDGVGPGFYAAAWSMVESTIPNFLQEFHAGVAQLERLNRAFIVLLPKQEGAVAPSAFKPISLQNCPVKILSKLMTSRLQQQIPKLIDIDQTGFIKGRSISENFVYATELVQCCHRRRCPTIILKLDFAKAFDSVAWSSLLRILDARGFPQIWIDWIEQILSTSKSAILINGVPGPWIQCKRGLRQGDALSPYLFLIVADVLQRLIKDDGRVRHPLVDCPCPVLQYADDTLMVVRADADDVIRLRQLLDLFLSATGLQINFSKSTAVPMHVPAPRLRRLLQVLQCQQASFPQVYLGLPLSHTKLNLASFTPLIAKVDRYLAGWKALLLNHASRLVLINSVLDGLPAHLMSALFLPAGTIDALDRRR